MAEPLPMFLARPSEPARPGSTLPRGPELCRALGSAQPRGIGGEIPAGAGGVHPPTHRPSRNKEQGPRVRYPRLKFLCGGGVPAINALIRN